MELGQQNVREPGYPAARIVAAKVHAQFAERHATEQQRHTPDLATVPDRETIEAIVDCAFWASLRHEEGYAPRVTIALLSPEQAGLPLIFERPLPLTPEILTRLAPAVERPGIHLGVWRDNGELLIWGAARTLPALCFVLEVIDPGLLVIKRRRVQDSGKFLNIAVLEGDQIKILDNQSFRLPDSPALITSLLGFDVPPASADFMSVLTQLSVSMRAHKRGGSVLVVPHGTEHWRESILGPTPYAVHPPYSELVGLIGREPDEIRQRQRQEALRRVIDVVAGLTAVDGAMVLTDRCEVLAFGAKIGRREGFGRIEHVLDTEPVEGAVARLVHPTQLGGTRHLSAAQFVQDQTHSFAMVASQDGRFTVFAWSAIKDAVHAYRVEALLL